MMKQLKTYFNGLAQEIILMIIGEGMTFGILVTPSESRENLRNERRAIFELGG